MTQDTNPDCQLDTPGKREPQLTICLHHAGLWKCLEALTVLTADGCGHPQSTMEGAIPRQRSLHSVRNDSSVSLEHGVLPWFLVQSCLQVTAVSSCSSKASLDNGLTSKVE